MKRRNTSCNEKSAREIIDPHALMKGKNNILLVDARVRRDASSLREDARSQWENNPECRYLRNVSLKSDFDDRS